MILSIILCLLVAIGVGVGVYFYLENKKAADKKAAEEAAEKAAEEAAEQAAEEAAEEAAEQPSIESQPSPIDGGWDNPPWTSCNKECGGIQTRAKSCINPAPQFGGKECQGAPFESRKCNTCISRYVVYQSGPDVYHNIAEIQVYAKDDPSTNIALNKPVTSNANVWDTLYPKNLVDGNESTIAHNGTENTNVNWTVDLQSDYDISKIVIVNRQDCCRERTKGATIILKNKDNVTTFSSDPLVGDMKKYIIEPPTTTVETDNTEWIMYGPAIIGDRFVSKILTYQDKKVYFIQDGIHTKMVMMPSDTAKYYIGEIDQFDINNWDTYSSYPGGYKIKQKTQQ